MGCCRCIFELAKPYGNNERMAGVKVLLEVQQNLAEMGGVYHLILVVDDQIPYFKKGQAIADPSSKKDMTSEGLMRSGIFALLVWGGVMHHVFGKCCCCDGKNVGD